MMRLKRFTEHFSVGSETAFAELMNGEAKHLGMKNQFKM